MVLERSHTYMYLCTVLTHSARSDSNIRSYSRPHVFSRLTIYIGLIIFFTESRIVFDYLNCDFY